MARHYTNKDFVQQMPSSLVLCVWRWADRVRGRTTPQQGCAASANTRRCSWASLVASFSIFSSAGRGGILLALSGEQRNAALLSHGGEGVHLAVGRNLLRFEAGTIPAGFVEKLFQIEVIEHLLEARRGYRHGRWIRILFQ